MNNEIKDTTGLVVEVLNRQHMVKIKNLPADYTEKDVEAFFKSCGQIQGVLILES